MDQDTQRFQLTPDTQVIRPSFTSGRSPNLPQGFPRKRYTVNDTFFWATGPPRRPSSACGWRIEDLDYLADYYGAGVWQFNTDRPFVQRRSDDLADAGSRSAAARRRGTTRTPSGASSRRTTCAWATSRSTSGLRYDFDTNLRSPDMIADLLANPQFAGLENLVTADRGNDLNNIQPRFGFAWDTRGDGRTVLRGGYGLVLGPQPAVVQHPRRRRQQPVHRRGHRSEPAAVLSRPDARRSAAARSRTTSAPPAAARSTCRATTSACRMSCSATLGIAKMLPGDTSLEVDFIHQVQKDLQTGRDANLPAQGPLATNPRPYPQFSSVTLINSLTDSNYDALQAQLRRRYQRHHLAGVVHLCQGHLQRHQRQRQLQHRSRGTRSATTTAGSTRTTAGRRCRCR